MKRKTNLPLLAWVCCLAVMFACMAVANAFQTDFGKVEVSSGAYTTDSGGVITFKLYRPVAATAEFPDRAGRQDVPPFFAFRKRGVAFCLPGRGLPIFCG